MEAVDYSTLAKELKLSTEQIANVVSLLDEGNTVPFITRYRKERTGNLDEEQIRLIHQEVKIQRLIKERADKILRIIESQDQLTPALKKAIESADSLKRLEDLYQPYRPKRASRANSAREKGLAPLSEIAWNPGEDQNNLEELAAAYINPEKELPDLASVLQGASDILAEKISDEADLKDQVRSHAWKNIKLSVVATKTGKESGKEFQDYFEYTEAVNKIPAHRVLAINRGDKEKKLRIKFNWDSELNERICLDYFKLNEHRFLPFLKTCVMDALTRLVQPGLERDIRRELTEHAEEHAVQVFATNLRDLLLQPPLRNKRVLAIDPGLRTGCKLAVIDESGTCIKNDLLFVTGSAEKKQAAKSILEKNLNEFQCEIIAIGNGTACRESEELVSDLIAEQDRDLKYIIVNEAGASIYSTSTVGREEFPDYDATVRGTISIGRRLQDPLSELVKIDPQHIGVGMYQHDINPKKLNESLEDVIESCVNYVGVDLNTASHSLLKHVSGLNQLIARRIIEWREKNGRFQTREQLKEVAGIGETTFTQAAGFLKVRGGEDPLDETWIHPESYEPARKILSRFEVDLNSTDDSSSRKDILKNNLDSVNVPELTSELGVGTLTFQDIIDSLSRPDQDPRSSMHAPVFKKGILKLNDLSEGMELTGTVLNVVDFGAFVDIGLKNSGLVHISQMSNGFVKNPHDLVSVGAVLKVWVLEINKERQRVSLSMMNPAIQKEPVKTKKKTSPKKPTENKKSGSGQKSSKNQSRNKKRTHKKHKKDSLGSKLTGDFSTKTHLTGFDELRQLWKDTHSH
jgi:protein Tex